MVNLWFPLHRCGEYDDIHLAFVIAKPRRVIDAVLKHFGDLWVRLCETSIDSSLLF